MQKKFYVTTRLCLKNLSRRRLRSCHNQVRTDSTTRNFSMCLHGII